MPLSKTTFVGIDLSGGRSPLSYAAFDQDRQLTALAGGEMEEVLKFLGDQPSVLVAVNAPPNPNRGLVRQSVEKQTPGHLRGSDLRLAEQELRKLSIHVSATPGREFLCPAWLQMGFALHQELSGLGFKPYPTQDAARQVMETHPHAAFCALIGSQPLPKPTLEGRLQRQVILFDKGLGIEDPMNFFEEITRHKLMRGSLPLEFVYASEELDALIAAYIAYLAGTEPGTLTAVGDKREGQIFLPAVLQEYKA